MHAIRLNRHDDTDAWKLWARHLLAAGVPPDGVTWRCGNEAADLFGDAEQGCPPEAPELRVPRAFAGLVAQALLHNDAQRFALMYRLLWRLQRQPMLLDDASDADGARATRLSKEVRRDIHKMRAFVRFREVPGDVAHFVAWFEPQHHILRANARFFVNRFSTMRWSILTPDGSIHWDGSALSEGPPAQRKDAPHEDAAEPLWQSYYASIFNPARLKVGAMLKEMPKRYWANMPETALVPGLIAGAQARAARMIAAGAASEAAPPRDWAEWDAGLRQCRRCPLHCNATQVVPGEGPRRARLMIVGEQPGDAEDVAGRPFVGPAGQLLDQHLATAGMDRSQAYVTNAVKHFKFQWSGKRRLHQNPTAGEIDHCRWWLDAERELVSPTHVLVLGASALRGMIGRSASINQARQQPVQLADGVHMHVTVHPSYLLRLNDNAIREQEERRFQQDLQRLGASLALVN